MTTLGHLAASGVPEWTALALTLLGTAYKVARDQRRSARAQGERLGELERKQELERTRRQQVESVLLDDGLRLPYWPPDGPLQRRRIRDSWPEPDVVDEDDRRQEPYTAEAARIPVPPLDPAISARHRRTTNA